VTRRTFLKAGAAAAAMPATLLAVDCSGPSSVTTTPSVAIVWNRAMLDAVTAANLGPTVTSRAAAVMFTCAYDAWAAYDRAAVGTQLADGLRRPASEATLANKSMAVSHAAHAALVDLFPGQAAKFHTLMRRLGYDPADASTDTSTPAGIGHAAAQAVLDFRHRDGSNQLGDLHAGAYSDYTGYAPVNDPDHLVDPNRWQPLRIPDGQGGSTVQRAVTPHWGNVMPFAMTSGSQFRPPAPARYPSESYLEQSAYLLGLSAGLTDLHKAITEYWVLGNGTEFPGGHWCLFADFVCRRDRQTLDSDVKLMFAVANAVQDAGIAAWDAKRAYDSQRPISSIRFLYAGRKVLAWGGPNKGTTVVDGDAWVPFQEPTRLTPAFPEHLSGHSTFSAAAAEVLKRFTGSDRFGTGFVVRSGSSQIEPGVTPARELTLSWGTFSEAADQAGMSRRYGGIHYPNADLEGRALGRRVGAAVWERAAALFRGEAP
jgi:hypothetical protein